MVLTTKLTKGDWIVHSNYGLGQVQGEDTKVLEGEETDYYIVKTDSATYWLPQDGLDTDAIRELAPETQFQIALKEIKSEPCVMEKDYRKRQARIVSVISSNSVVEFARLIRDLYWRRRQKHLNENEKRVLDLIKERFAREWSVAAEINEAEALSKLESTLGMVFENQKE
jgi:CarD family transcriptional regulator